MSIHRQRRRHMLWFVSLVAVGCKLDPRRPIDRIAPDSMFPDSEESRGEFRTTESGLQYRTITPGNQRRSPKRTSSVTVHYRGWLDDNTEFDSSYKHGKPITFKVSQVVQGWQEALQLMTEGQKVELIVPYELGYGERGEPPMIPPRATLHFEIELLEIR